MIKNRRILKFATLVIVAVLIPLAYKAAEEIIWRIQGPQIRKAAIQYGIEANLFRSGAVSCPQVEDSSFDFLKDSRPAYACAKNSDCALLRTDEGWYGLTYRAVNCGYAVKAINFYSHLMIDPVKDMSREKYRYWARHRPLAECVKSACTVRAESLDPEPVP